MANKKPRPIGESSSRTLTRTQTGAPTLIVLLNILIICVVDAICFWAIDKFVRDGGSLTFRPSVRLWLKLKRCGEGMRPVDQAGLRGDELDMLAISNAPRLGEGENGFIDRICGFGAPRLASPLP